MPSISSMRGDMPRPEPLGEKVIPPVTPPKKKDVEVKPGVFRGPDGKLWTDLPMPKASLSDEGARKFQAEADAIAFLLKSIKTFFENRQEVFAREPKGKTFAVNYVIQSEAADRLWANDQQTKFP